MDLLDEINYLYYIERKRNRQWKHFFITYEFCSFRRGDKDMERDWIDALNPKILLVNHIGEGNMPIHTKTFGDRITKWHELDIITWGNGTDHVNGREWPVQAGDIFYRVPGMKNRHDLPYHCYFFVFDPYYDQSKYREYQKNPLHWEEEDMKKNDDHSNALFPHTEVPYLGKAVQMDSLTLLCRKIMIAFSSEKSDPLYLKILFLKLLYEVRIQLGYTKEEKINRNKYRPYWQQIQDLKGYVRSHPTEKISMESMARRLNISYSFFSRLFKGMTGETFSAYVVRIKLDYVKVQLMDTNKSVEEIALECGFSDPNYLYTLFRNKVGCTPMEYRILTAGGKENLEF